LPTEWSFTVVEENQIKRLCEQITAKDEAEVRRICAQLHDAIHEHIEALRQQVFNIQAVPGSFVIEKDRKKTA
jgi:hypothetical protein